MTWDKFSVRSGGNSDQIAAKNLSKFNSAMGCLSSQTQLSNALPFELPITCISEIKRLHSKRLPYPRKVP